MLKLVIADDSAHTLKNWSNVFSEIDTIYTLESNIPTCMSLPNIDAVLMMGMFAHQRYGGQPKMGESQVLSTQGASGMPKFVVTTPPFPAHLKNQNSAGQQEIISAPNERISTDEETYILFTKVFECVNQFNKLYRETLLQTLAIHLSFLNFSQNQTDVEAKAALRAYREIYPISAPLKNSR